MGEEAWLYSYMEILTCRFREGRDQASWGGEGTVGLTGYGEAGGEELRDLKEGESNRDGNT